MSPAFDIQGHRGARGLAPENTLPAFGIALELGVSTLELDTVVSADRRVVVSHDPWMSSVYCTRRGGKPVTAEEERDLILFDMTYDEIREFDCGTRRHPEFPRQQSQPAVKPLLGDVIALAEPFAEEHARPRIGYNVETKSQPGGDGRLHPPPDEFVDLIWQEVEEAGISERFTLQSFDVRTLQATRKRGLPVRISLLVSPSFMSPSDHLERGIKELGFVPEIYSPDYHLVTRQVIDRAHSMGMQVIPWTVNDADEMVSLRGMGVDGLITDYPDVAVECLHGSDGPIGGGGAALTPPDTGGRGS